MADDPQKKPDLDQAKRIMERLVKTPPKPHWPRKNPKAPHSQPKADVPKKRNADRRDD